MTRFTVSTSAGQRGGRRFCIVDTLDRQGGKGMRRVEFHATEAAARRKARKLNAATDHHGNMLAREGADRCFCGCKYWEIDRCIDCGTSIDEVRRGA